MKTKSPCKRIGITGEKGFIGGAVAEALLRNGYEVIPLDRQIFGYAGDGGGNSKNIGKLSWVLHFAAKTSIEESFNEPFSTYANNFESTLAALKVSYFTGAAFLYMSSYVYGAPRYLPVDETHPVDILNPYMGSKFIGEELCRQLCGLWEKPLVILRGFTIYGDCRVAGRLVSDLAEAARRGQPLVINDPKPKRDYLYIKDFCALLFKIIARRRAVSGTYNVGYGRSYSNREVAEMINAVTGGKNRIIVKSFPRANDVPDCAADIRLVSRTFSWSPAYPLEKGLRDLLQRA